MNEMSDSASATFMMGQPLAAVELVFFDYSQFALWAQQFFR